MSLRGIALRLTGVLQSWGGPTAGDDRPTFDVPTKSGVLGIVAGAMGIDRAAVDTLAALHHGLALVVRVDNAGTPGRDFHTAENVPNADFKLRADPVVSRRSYLYDASFVALLVEQQGLRWPLGDLAWALRYPRYAPFLGRRASPPSRPVLRRSNEGEAVLVGETWEALLAQVEFDGGSGDQRGRAPHVHVEARLVPEGERDGLLEQRLRDELIGRLPRLFDERRVLRVPFDAARHVPSAFTPSPPGRSDSIEGWWNEP